MLGAACSRFATAMAGGKLKNLLSLAKLAQDSDEDEDDSRSRKKRRGRKRKRSRNASASSETPPDKEKSKKGNKLQVAPGSPENPLKVWAVKLELRPHQKKIKDLRVDQLVPLIAGFEQLGLSENELELLGSKNSNGWRRINGKYVNRHRQRKGELSQLKQMATASFKERLVTLMCNILDISSDAAFRTDGDTGMLQHKREFNAIWLKRIQKQGFTIIAGVKQIFIKLRGDAEKVFALEFYSPLHRLSRFPFSFRFGVCYADIKLRADAEKASALELCPYPQVSFWFGSCLGLPL